MEFVCDADSRNFPMKILLVAEELFIRSFRCVFIDYEEPQPSAQPPAEPTGV